MAQKLIRQVVIFECDNCGIIEEFPAAAIDRALVLADEKGWLADPLEDFAQCPDCADEMEAEETAGETNDEGEEDE